MDTAFRRAVAQARRHGDLYFAGLLSEERIMEAFGEASRFWQGWIYTPAVTLWVFLAQCFSADHSCRDAVAHLIAWRLAQGLRPCSADTGTYCTARDDLPEEVCHRLVRSTGRQADEDAPAKWRWMGHRVLDVDGSTLTMPDTRENQAEYPQQSGQKPGCGFPIARIVVVFSLAVGTVLADRYFSGWFDLALLKQRGVHSVVRKHQLRGTDFRTGQRLDRDDHLVCWSKPARPKWMPKAQYDALPDTLTLREVRVRVQQKGFRTRELVVVTTLLDPKRYPAAEIAKLYRQRWQAELNLRSLKIVLQMDHLRCKTPHRVRNEFYMHLLAYNLLRRLIAAAAFQAGVEPWTVSFKGAMQTMNHLLPLLSADVSTADWCGALLEAVATHVVGNRPDRFEPRVRKRRPKSYKLMRQPRASYKRHAA